MTIHPKSLVSLIKKHKYIDEWFPFRYSFDLYNSCPADCVYCPGSFQYLNQIDQYTNLLSTLEKELKHISEKSLIGIGGGNNEIFYPDLGFELELSKIFELLLKKELHPFIITKNEINFKIINLFKQFIKKNITPTIVLSISSPENKIAKLLEPNCISIKKRFKLAAQLKESGCYVGLAIMPVIPFINDDIVQLEYIMQMASDLEIDFVLLNNLKLSPSFSPLFFQKLKDLYPPDICVKIEKIYENKETKEYYLNEIFEIFHSLCKKYRIKPRVGLEIFKNNLEIKDQISVILNQIYFYFLHSGKKREAFRFAHYSLNKISNQEFNNILAQNKLQSLPGIGKKIEKEIKHMVEFDNYSYYEDAVKSFFYS